MVKMPRPRDLMEACPNPTSALLMQHIIYCSRYAKKQHGGHRWFVSSHADYASSTGLSARQVKRSLAALRERGLIVTEQHLSYGRNVTHVRVALEGETENGLPEVPEKSPLEETARGLLKGVDQTEYQKKDQMNRAAGNEEKMEIELPWMKGKAKKAAEIIEANNEKVKNRFSEKGLEEAMDRAEKTPTQNNLEKLFQVAWVAGGYGFRPDLTKKERGQLTQLVNACASTEVGVYLIVEATQNWELLSVHLKQIMKSSQPPQKPTIGYILACKVPVLSWLAQRAKDSAVQALSPEDADAGWDKFS